MSVDSHSTLNLATEQLEDAIRLHLNGRYASAATLAGAAEEVFGKHCERLGQRSVMQEGFALERCVGLMFPGQAAAKPFQAYADRENATRNRLKHLVKGAEWDFKADLAVDSAKMIVRGIENARRIGLQVSGCEAFTDWFYEYIVGV